MGIVNGIFVFNGNPQNGATAKLWDLDAFASYADSGETVQDNPLAADSIELNVSAGGVFAVGDVIRMDTELCRIWAINANLLYIIRAWRGTTAAVHVQTTTIYDETITAPAEDDAEPGSGQVGGSVTTGVTYGGDGAYRWTAVDEGEYYASVEYDGHRCFFHHLVERDDPTLQQILQTRGDTVHMGADGPIRLAKGNNGDLYQMGANEPSWVASGGLVATHEFWVPVTFSANGVMQIHGDFPVAQCTAATDDAFISFKVPHDFSAITSAEIIVIPTATQAAANWDIDSDYGAEGEAYNTHSEADAATTYNVTNNQIFAVDISGILTALAADDYVGVKLTQSNAAHNVNVLGVRFRYS